MYIMENQPVKTNMDFQSVIIYIKKIVDFIAKECCTIYCGY